MKYVTASGARGSVGSYGKSTGRASCRQTILGTMALLTRYVSVWDSPGRDHTDSTSPADAGRGPPSQDRPKEDTWAPPSDDALLIMGMLLDSARAAWKSLQQQGPGKVENYNVADRTERAATISLSNWHTGRTTCTSEVRCSQVSGWRTGQLTFVFTAFERFPWQAY